MCQTSRQRWLCSMGERLGRSVSYWSWGGSSGQEEARTGEYARPYNGSPMEGRLCLCPFPLSLRHSRQVTLLQGAPTQYFTGLCALMIPVVMALPRHWPSPVAMLARVRVPPPEQLLCHFFPFRERAACSRRAVVKP